MGTSSSGQSELQGITRGCVEGLFVKNLLGFFGYDTTVEIETDSSAAKGFTNRLRAGKKMRHVEVQNFWDLLDYLKQEFGIDV